MKNDLPEQVVHAVAEYDPWKDPLWVRWREEQLRNQGKRIDSLSGAVESGDPLTGRLSSLIGNHQEQVEAFAQKRPVSALQALWAPLNANDNGQAIRFGDSINLRNGGRVTVEDRHVHFHGQASKDIVAIETGILHAKAHWGRQLTINGQDEHFKAVSWAYAQLHGVTVTNYEPTAEARELAKNLKSERQSLNPILVAPFIAPRTPGNIPAGAVTAATPVSAAAIPAGAEAEQANPLMTDKLKARLGRYAQREQAGKAPEQQQGLAGIENGAPDIPEKKTPHKKFQPSEPLSPEKLKRNRIRHAPLNAQLAELRKGASSADTAAENSQTATQHVQHKKFQPSEPLSPEKLKRNRIRNAPLNAQLAELRKGAASADTAAVTQVEAAKATSATASPNHVIRRNGKPHITPKP